MEANALVGADSIDILAGVFTLERKLLSVPQYILVGALDREQGEVGTNE